jgi:hypothetical protein
LVDLGFWQNFGNNLSYLFSFFEIFSIRFHSFDFSGIFGTLPWVSLTGMASKSLDTLESSSAKLALFDF